MNIRILETMVSGIPLVVGLRRIWDPHVYVVSGPLESLHDALHAPEVAWELAYPDEAVPHTATLRRIGVNHFRLLRPELLLLLLLCFPLLLLLLLHCKSWLPRLFQCRQDLMHQINAPHSQTAQPPVLEHAPAGT